MDEKASDYYDPGYDGVHIDDQPNDMYFRSQNTNLIIQGVGFFNDTKRHALSVKTNQTGYIEIVLDGVENFASSIKVFIFDKETGLYHNIKTQPFIIKLNAGIYNDRFYLTFTNRGSNIAQSKVDSDTINETIDVKYLNTNQVLQIINEDVNATVNKVYLYNLVGQLVNAWDVRNEIQTAIQIPMTSNSTGVYIVKVETTNGSISRKISIE